MKHIVKYLIMACMGLVTSAMATSCLPNRGAIYEDGEWDRNDATDDILLNNSEIDMDDIYHD